MSTGEPRNQTELHQDIALYRVNLIVGCVSLASVVINLFILLATEKFRKQFKFLIGLGVADFFTVNGIILEACYRHDLFESVSKTSIVPTMTSADCIKLWTVVLTIGDFATPLIQLLMASERLLAVARPMHLNSFCHSWLPMCVIAGVVAIIITIPAGISILDPVENVKYGCGRKAAFSTAFGVIDYSTNVLGYSIAFGLNLFVMHRARTISLSPKQYQKIRSYTMLSFISTVLVSIPNLCSLINAVIIRLPDPLLTPTPILACINCSMQLFVYLYFSREYRNRVLYFATLGKVKIESSVFPMTNIPKITVNMHEV